MSAKHAEQEQERRRPSVVHLDEWVTPDVTDDRQLAEATRDRGVDRNRRMLAQMPRGDSARLVVRPDLTFNGVKIFSATMFAPREQLGETVTAWMAANPQLIVTEFVVTQSSDSQFHCVAITVFYWERLMSR